MAKKISKIHDKFFKKIMEDIEVAKDFLDSFLPDKIKTIIDLDTISPDKTSFINDELSESFADVIFSLNLRNKEEKVYISILLEHKSVVDKFTPVQVLYYLSQAYYTQIKNGEVMKIIIPLVFYHGEAEWKYVDLADLFLDIPQELKRYIPSHDTNFVDLYRIDDEELALMTNLFLSSALLTQKYSRDSDALLNKINLIFNSINKVKRKNLIAAIIVYYIQLIEIKDIDLEEVINPLSSNIKNIFMSTYDMIIEKGIDKGIEREKIEVILKGFDNGATLEFLSKITDISIAQIEKIISDNKAS